jgi:hypothetical protein
MLTPETLADNAAVRRSIYAGEILHLPASPASLDLIARVQRAAERELGEELQQVHRRLETPEILGRLAVVRRALQEDAAVLAGVRAVMRGAGFDPRAHATDRLRLRAILHEGHRNPAAAPAYATHRDTWYANPRSQINWWVPLHEIIDQQGIFFYPDLYTQAVPNTSAGFDLDRWVARVGWQALRRPADAVYPEASVAPDPGRYPRREVRCRAGEVILFSAGQLHGTGRNESGLSRFSVDFRSVCLEDHQAGLGAPDPDNRSTGSTLRDYTPPESEDGP